MAAHVWLIALKDLDDDARAIKLGELAGVELGAGQDRFVGEPLRMALAGLAEPSRYPYVLDTGGAAIGAATLQSGAARAAGWADDDSAWLLRGFAIDHRQQGRGYGTAAAVAAVREAARLTAKQGGDQRGVVLSVNEANPAGRAAYAKAGFEDRGQYLGGNAGPQRILYRGF